MRTVPVTGSPAGGTTVTFWADGDIFETTTYTFDTISRRLQEMAFLNAGLKIVLRDEAHGIHHQHTAGTVDEGVVRRRMAAATEEMRQAGQFDYVIINDTLEEALQQLNAVVVAARQQRDGQLVRHQHLINQLQSLE